MLNNRTTIWQELAGTSVELKDYLLQEFSTLLDNPYLEEWISVHLDYSEQRRVNYIIGNMEEFTGKL